MTDSPITYGCGSILLGLLCLDREDENTRVDARNDASDAGEPAKRPAPRPNRPEPPKQPAMLAKTGLTVAEHQARSVASFLRLRALAPSVRWLPVLQGQTVADYLAHVALYKAAGVELRSLALVGVGSVCRRQSTGEIVELLAALAGLGLRLHGFGVKSRGLALAGEHLASADSLAWSLAARREGNDPNSLTVAEAWRTKILSQIGGLA